VTLFVETSAVLRWLFAEVDGETMRSTLAAAEKVTCSRLALIETRRVLRRAEREERITAAQTADLLAAFAQAASTWAVLEISEEVARRAEEGFPGEPVRTLDAIHLASALYLRQSFPDLVILSADEHVRRNAALLGFSPSLAPTRRKRASAAQRLDSHDADGEAERALHGHELRWRERRQSLGQRTLRDRRHRVEVRDATARQTFGTTESDLRRNAPDSGRDRCDDHELANGVGLVAGEQHDRPSADGRGKLCPPDLPAPHHHASSSSLHAVAAVASAATASLSASGRAR
jgi:predicted nucleic acid-binding protein